MTGFYRPGQRDEQRMRRFMSISGAGITAPVTGLDPYFANVISLLHFEGTNGSTTFTDQKSPTWTAAVDAQISTTQARYGTASFKTPTISNGAHIASTSITSLSASAWTAELSGWLSSLPASGISRQLFRFVNASGFGVSLFLSVNTPGAPNTTSPFLRLFISSNGTSFNIANGVYSTAIPIGAGGWGDFSMQFTGTAYECYFAGAKVLSVASTAGVCPFTLTHIGGNPSTATATWLGYLDEWRLTNSVARYTDPYTPSGPFPDS